METRERIIEAAKQEFLLKGYEKSSLRAICKQAGVTTGALYFLFESKERLFCDIVEPFVAAGFQMSEELRKREILHPETAEDNERQLMTTLYNSKDLIILVMEKAAGTRYADFPQQMEHLLKGFFRQYFAEYTKHNIDDKLITILVQGRIRVYMTILKESSSLQEALQLTESMACYADAGTNAVIHKINEKNPIKP